MDADERRQAHIYREELAPVGRNGLAKIWRNLKGLEFPSIFLELAVMDALNGQSFGRLSSNFKRVLAYFYEDIGSVRLIDPANTANVISDDLTTNEERLSMSALDSLVTAHGGGWGGGCMVGNCRAGNFDLKKMLLSEQESMLVRLSANRRGVEHPTLKGVTLESDWVGMLKESCHGVTRLIGRCW